MLSKAQLETIDELSLGLNGLLKSASAFKTFLIYRLSTEISLRLSMATLDCYWFTEHVPRNLELLDGKSLLLLAYGSFTGISSFWWTYLEVVAITYIITHWERCEIQRHSIVCRSSHQYCSTNSDTGWCADTCVLDTAMVGSWSNGMSC